MGAGDPEVVNPSTSTQGVGAQKEAIMALRRLFEDFEDQVKYQDEVHEESTSETEESRDDPLAQFVKHTSI